VFARYNQAVWPAQLLFYLLAGAVLWRARRPRARSGQVVAGVLAFLWAWMAVVYHWTFFRPINPAAAVFAALFLLQALLLAHAGLVRGGISLAPSRSAAGIAGMIQVAYALVGYPLIGLAAGVAYPRAPTFGLPCPTTIFTLGVLLWAERIPVRLLAIPFAWSLLGTSAALQHGIVQDLALPAAGLAAAALALRENRRATGAGRGEGSVRTPARAV
jgi:hypothetical protein